MMMHPKLRAVVTIASRIMLPADAILAAWIGAAWAFQDDRRTAIPALYALRDVWPISATGWILVALATAITIGLVIGNRTFTAVALGCGVIVYLGLTMFIGLSLLGGALASFAAPAFTLYIAVAHLASLVSLAFDELSDDLGHWGTVR